MERRANYRSKTDRKVAGRIPATPISVTLLDLSVGGCQIRTNGIVIAPGTTILLELAKGREVAGQVAWHEGDRAGITFHEKVSSETLFSILGVSEPSERNGDSLKDGFGRELPLLQAKMRFD